MSPVAHEKIHSHIGLVEQLKWSEVNDFLQNMTDAGWSFLSSVGSNQEYSIHRVLDIRYEGQGHEITIEIPDGILGEHSIEEIQQQFEIEYQFRYGRIIKEVPLEAVTWRVQVRGVVPSVDVVQMSDVSQHKDPYKGEREVYFEETGLLKCPVYDRYSLVLGEEYAGPAIVEEKESTLVIGINASFTIDAYKNIKVNMPF